MLVRRQMRGWERRCRTVHRVSSWQRRAAHGKGRHRKVEMAGSLLLRHAEPVVSVHFTGDGARIVTATDQSATIWDRATGAQIYTATDVGNHLADALLLPGGRQLFQADLAFGDSCL